MGKIPYCGKEERRPYQYTEWTPERIAELHELQASGLTIAEIAEEAGYSRSTVQNALAKYPASPGAPVKRGWQARAERLGA